MPSWEIFEHQTQQYRYSAMSLNVTARIPIEQASILGYVGSTPSRIICMKTCGASAPLKELQRHFGFEPNHVVAAAKELPGRR